jgi:microcystin-dependent protein
MALSVSNASSPASGGGPQPVTLITPYLAMNYIIAYEGIFPSRN